MQVIQKFIQSTEEEFSKNDYKSIFALSAFFAYILVYPLGLVDIYLAYNGLAHIFNIYLSVVVSTLLVLILNYGLYLFCRDLFSRGNVNYFLLIFVIAMTTAHLYALWQNNAGQHIEKKISLQTQIAKKYDSLESLEVQRFADLKKQPSLNLQESNAKLPKLSAKTKAGQAELANNAAIQANINYLDSTLNENLAQIRLQEKTEVESTLIFQQSNFHMQQIVYFVAFALSVIMHVIYTHFGAKISREKSLKNNLRLKPSHKPSNDLYNQALLDLEERLNRLQQETVLQNTSLEGQLPRDFPKDLPSFQEKNPEKQEKAQNSLPDLLTNAPKIESPVTDFEVVEELEKYYNAYPTIYYEMKAFCKEAFETGKRPADSIRYFQSLKGKQINVSRAQALWQLCQWYSKYEKYLERFERENKTV